MPNAMLLRIANYPPLLLLTSAVVAPDAAGHEVEIDGIASEWLDRAPSGDNLGLIARDPAGEGEFVWRDLAGDERTDLARPDRELDLVEVRIAGGRTLDAAGLALLLRSRSAPGPTAQLQIAIDLDGEAGRGRSWLVGDAETRVAETARWEHLVQTRFGDCVESVCAARVWHAPGTFDDVALASRGEDGVEIFVPWSGLGLAAAPRRPVRFTVASCRADSEQRCLDLGGPDVANVIDVISDGGRPGSAQVTSWTEVGDQTIDHQVAVAFDPDDNEVYAPLLIDRFSVDGSGAGPWIALFNQSPLELPLAGYQLGDEETAGGDEGMLRLPGSTIGPLERIAVARRGSSFRAAYGRRPHFEQIASDPAVPDLAPATAWASGDLDLDPAGDEVLLLDPSNTLLDVVSYGAGRYPGVVPHSPAGRGRLLLRGLVTQDTDSCAADFQARPVCATEADCDNPCLTCWDHACLPLPAAIPCSDGDACNGFETCDGAGRCLGGREPDCDDGDPCTDDGCDAASGCLNLRQPRSACFPPEPTIG